MIKISSAQRPGIMPTILPSQQSKSLVGSSAWKTRALVTSTRRYEAPPRRLLMSRIYAQDSTEKAWSLGLLEWAGKAVPQGPLVMAAKQSWKSIWLVFMNELAPQDKTGGYKRPTYRFNKNRLGDSEFPVSAGSGRYVLMIGGPCPWCHRVLMAAELRGLISGDIIDIVQLVDNPEKASRGGWVFQTKEDPYFGCSDLRQVYDLLCKEEGGFLGRCTAPLLVDTVSKSIISNESSEILEMFDEIHVEGVTSSIQLRPAHLRAEIDEFNSRIFDALNNGVYKCGFATKQSAYDAAYKALEETLRELDTLFSTSRFVMGTAFTDSDLRLFATISRFDAVYSTLFKCVRRITEYPHIHRWFQDCARLKLPGHGSHRYLSSTVDIDDCRRSYFTQLFPLNPGGIIPSGPTSSDILPPAGGWEQQGAEEPFLNNLTVNAMTIAQVHISRSSNDASIQTTPDVHHLQGCSISYDGSAPVSTYFKPKRDMKKEETLPEQDPPSTVKKDPGATYTGYFRGRCLRGIDSPIPLGYCGYVVELGLHEECNDETQQVPVGHRIASKFDSFTGWKHHVVPDGSRDPLHRCLQWCHTASSLHE